MFSRNENSSFEIYSSFFLLSHGRRSQYGVADSYPVYGVRSSAGKDYSTGLRAMGVKRTTLVQGSFG